MLPAVIGLAGVLVGAIITIDAQYLLLRRNEYASALVGVRLIAVELNALIASHDDFNSRGSPPETPIWERHQAAVALVLPPDHWRKIADAYAQLARVNTPVEGAAPNSNFVGAASRAIQCLVSDAEGPLRRRASLIERRNVHWPNEA
jgi:hypothetical protein